MLITTLDSIPINTSTQVSVEDVAISLSSSFYTPTLETFTNEYYIISSADKIVVHPKMEWLPSTNISITVEGVTHNYLTKEDFYFYLPEQVAYSKGFIADQDPWTKLISLGLATTGEKNLLKDLPVGIKEVGHEVSKCLVSVFGYNNTSENVAITMLKGLRKAMQLLVLLELEVVVEYFLFTAGPSIEWLRKAAIPFSLADSEVIAKHSEIRTKVDSLEAALVRGGMNIDLAESLKYHLDPRSDYYELVRSLILYFMALRYHSNGEFSY